MKIDYDKEKVKMAVWGIGAYFPREKENIVEQFYQEEKIVLLFRILSGPKPCHIQAN